MSRNMLLTCGEHDGTWWTDTDSKHQILVADSMADALSSYSKCARYFAGNIFITNNVTDFVSAYTPEGKLVWSKYLAENANSRYRDFVDLEDNTIAALGWNENGRQLVTIFNPTDGTVIRHQTYGIDGVYLVPKYFDNGIWFWDTTAWVKYDLNGVLLGTVTGYAFTGSEVFAQGYLFDGSTKVHKISLDTLTHQWVLDLASLDVGGFDLIGIDGAEHQPSFIKANGNILIPTYKEDNVTFNHQFIITEIDITGVVVGVPHLIFTDMDEGSEIYRNFAVTDNGPYLAIVFANRRRTDEVAGKISQSHAIYGVKYDWTTEKLLDSKFAHSTQLVVFPDINIVGTVDDNGPAVRDLSLLHAESMKVIDKTDSVGGIYTLKGLTNTSHVVLCESLNNTKNWKIHAHLTPSDLWWGDITETWGNTNVTWGE